MPPLPPDLRRDLERAVVRARDIAEEGARASLAVLGVEAPAAPGALSPADRDLRTALRARGRSLGGGVLTLGIDGLVEEIAYEQWHRMLFARFLAENGLLLHPGGAPVSLAEVAELAAEEGERDPWILSARYAAAMLPGIFRADDPAHQVRFAPEHRSSLESVLASLPPELFTADDALGWVYQFWQAKRKKEVNDSGRKIGGADLPPVTQLFTEHYMVRFLLENSLGAWWAARHLKSPLLREWEYLRFRDDGTPAAGSFEGWPEKAAEITVMDPCMGSGHFLVAAADLLRKMRIEEEGLSLAAAAAAVLRDNLFGLEIDARCTQLAAFALALDAWKVGGYQPLPVPNIACSGIAIKGQLEDWRRLAGGDANMAAALERLYALFQDAPELGSLIDPAAAAGKGLWQVDADQLLAKLDQALARETDDPAAAVFGAGAEGTVKAARLLAGRYWLVATNPPFLGQRWQGSLLQLHLTSSAVEGKGELAAAMFVRGLEMLRPDGSASSVIPENLLFLRSFRNWRRELLMSFRLGLVSRLGESAFESPAAAGAFVGMLTVTRAPAKGDHIFVAFDASAPRNADQKAELLTRIPLRVLRQDDCLADPDSVIAVAAAGSNLLAEKAWVNYGSKPGQTTRVTRRFWEFPGVAPLDWTPLESTPDADRVVSGKTEICLTPAAALARGIAEFGVRGSDAWGRPGVIVSKMRSLPTAIYCGQLFDDNTYVLTPKEDADLPAIFSFVSSRAYVEAVRLRNPKIAVDTSALVKVPFDLEHWQKVAAQQYPNGLPEPHSDDPTQWLFKGVVPGSTSTLQVAVARLLGYRWPDQEPDALDELADADGIVSLTPVLGEAPAHERLRALLAHAYGSAWSPALLDRLLAEAGLPGTTLESWLRDGFFAQHTRLFANRPFIWQVWDGRSDGFSVLINYHRLDTNALKKLAYTYLNDWIERQKARRDEPTAETRLVAALSLQRKLEQILVGEPPHDIYVRWKPLAQQPIGWEPDLDDGVRLNIRPFVTASILRAKFTINWNKDRGANPDGTERLNDLHYNRAQKLAAREKG